MESHPSYSTLAPFIAKYPQVGGCLFLTYNDLVYAQSWKGVEVLELPQSQRVALKGIRPETNASHIIVPCSLSESLSMTWVTNVFKELNDTPDLYLGILSEDSSVVYYRLSSGIVKPPS